MQVKIIIIGGGFGGLAAVNKLGCSRLNVEVTLIDKKETFDFLPELPDVVGRGVKPEHLTYNIESLIKRKHFKFLQAEVTEVDLQKRQVIAGGKSLAYDYLVIASGSETNFYGQEEIKRFAYKLDSVNDAVRISQAVKSNSFDNFIISGGGYTGIEAATNLWKYCHDHKISKKIYIVERALSLLGPLPQDLKSYTVSNIEKLGIKVILNTTIAKIDAYSVSLSDGQVFDKAMLIWAAGVKTVDFIWKLNLSKNAQGRLKIDEYLRADERCFVVGDAAEVTYKGKILRMAVQFSIFQGSLTGGNIIRAMGGKPLKKYRPLDLGYVVPMANNKSCGLIMGLFVSGWLATFLHYMMCAYRSASLKNAAGMIKDVLFKH
jgi:NADH:ubiquinone reductase (H+-translocating)